MPRNALTALLLAATLATPAGAAPQPGCFALETVQAVTQGPPEPTCVAVRPGIMVRVVDLAGDPQPCQTSYLFYGSDGARYLGVEGYCTLASTDCTELVVLHVIICLGRSGPEETDGPVVYANGKGPKVLLDDKRIGEVRYAVYETGAEFTNFALVRLDPKVVASPAIRGWGGPTALERRVSTTPEDVLVTAPFALYEGKAVRGFYDTKRFYGVWPAPVGLGGPVLTADGKAVGVVSTMSDGAYVERVEPLMKRAADRLRIRLRLATAPFAG